MNEITAPTTTPNTSSDQTMFALLHAAHALEDRLESAVAAVGLSMPKYSVLSELVAARNPLPLSDLANRLSCVRSNITQLVDRLETDGLVRRVDCPNDRRSVKAEITEVGRDRQAAAAIEVEKVQREFDSQLDEKARAALSRMAAALGT